MSEGILSDFDLLVRIRQDASVNQLIAEDSDTEIYIQHMDTQDIAQIRQEYPKLLPSGENLMELVSVNVISSKMKGNLGYKKIRLYMTPTGEIIKKFETN